VGLDVNLTLLQQMTLEERTVALAQLGDHKVVDIMSQPAITISHLATLTQVIDLLNVHHLKRLPVVDDMGHLMGMITRSDVLREIVFTMPLNANQQHVLVDWDAVVGDVMLETAQTVKTNALLQEIIQVLKHEVYKRLLVLDESGKAVGVITESDLLARVDQPQRQPILAALRGHEQAAQSHLTASALMTSPIIVVAPQTPAHAALRLLLENQIKRLPVVDENGFPLGMVGRAGLMEVLIQA
jgi:CBS domain-containing protein